MHRNGLTSDTRQVTLNQTASRDDVLLSREERSFRMWINSLGVDSYVNNVFEDVRHGYEIIWMSICVYLQMNWALTSFLMQMGTSWSTGQSFSRICQLEAGLETSN